jgi:hypothetical protein
MPPASSVPKDKQFIFEMSLMGYTADTFSSEIRTSLKRAISSVTSVPVTDITLAVTDITRRLALNQGRRLAIPGIDIEVTLVAKGTEQQAKTDLELAKLIDNDTARGSLAEIFRSELTSAGMAAPPAEFQLSTASYTSAEMKPDDSGDSAGSPDSSGTGSNAGMLVGVVVAVVAVGAITGFVLYSKNKQERTAHTTKDYEENAIVTTGEQRSPTASSSRKVLAIR